MVLKSLTNIVLQHNIHTGNVYLKLYSSMNKFILPAIILANRIWCIPCNSLVALLWMSLFKMSTILIVKNTY